MTERYEAAVPIDTLVEHPRNPRIGDVEAIIESIEANGFGGALVVQESTRYVMAGNHRLKAARLLGMETLPVLWSDADDTRALTLLVADNRAFDLGYTDTEAVLSLLDVLGPDSMLGSLYTSADLDIMRTVHQQSEHALGTVSDAHAIRSITLLLPIDEYDQAIRALVAIRTATSEATNADVLLRLIREAGEEIA